MLNPRSPLRAWSGVLIFALVFASGCGRIGFDLSGADSESDGDGDGDGGIDNDGGPTFDASGDLVPPPLQGNLDPTFGVGGLSELDLVPGEIVFISGVERVGNEGYLLSAYLSVDGGDSELVFARIDRSGNLDTSVMDNGIRRIAVAGLRQTLNSGSDGSGHYWVSGYVDIGSGRDFAVFQSDDLGNLDPAFGAGGKVIMAVTAENDWATDVHAIGDGRLAICGSINLDSNIPTQGQAAIVVLEADGSPSTGFGENGIAVTPVGALSEGCSSLVVRSDGSIIAAGSKSDGVNKSLVVWRLLPNGNFDPSFQYELEGRIAVAIALDAQERVVVAAQPWISGSYMLIRLVLDGSPDDDFGTQGIALLAQSGSMADLAVFSDGSVVTVGSIFGAPVPRPVVFRVGPDGALDESFGSSTDGFFVTANQGFFRRIVTDPDGRVVIVGGTPSRLHIVAIE